MIRVVLLLIFIKSIIFGAVGEFKVTSSTHEVGVVSSSSFATFNWEKPEESDGDKISSYIWYFGESSSIELEDDNNGSISSSTNSLKVNIYRDGEFYFHIAPVTEEGDIAKTTIFGKIVVDITPPPLSIINKVVDNGSVEVSLKSGDSESSIYYTLDGSEPTISSSLYSTPVPIYSSITIKAKAVDIAGNWSSTEERTLDVDYSEHIATVENIAEDEVVATTALYGAKEPKPRVTVTGGDVIKYRYRVGVNRYSDWKNISEGVDISRLADGKYTLYIQGQDSIGNIQQSETELAFEIDNTPPSNLKFYLNGSEISNQYITSSQLGVTLQTEGNDTIRYTTDGDTPSVTFGQIYSGSLDVFEDTTVKAMAYDSLGNSGDVVSISFKFDRENPTEPKILDRDGVELNSSNLSFYSHSYIYSTPQLFQFSSTDNLTATPKVFWSLDSVPNRFNSNSGDAVISTSGLLNAVAFDDVNNSSTMVSFEIVIDENPPSLSSPEISDDCQEINGLYECSTNIATVSINGFDSETPDGVSIYYTTNGNIPTKSSSPLLNSEVNISLSENDKTLKFIAYDIAGNRSDIESLTAKSGGDSSNGDLDMTVSLSISSGDELNGDTNEINLSITNGGSDPVYYWSFDDNNFSYQNDVTAGISLSDLTDGNHTLRVIAFNGEFNSTVNSVDFYLDSTPPSTPVIGGDSWFYSETNITLLTDESGASIYYSIDGATPSILSHEYSGVFPITTTLTVKAVAVDRVGNMSGIASKSFQMIPTCNTGYSLNSNYECVAIVTPEPDTPEESNSTDDTNETESSDENSSTPTDNSSSTEDDNTTSNITNIGDIISTDDGERITINSDSGEELEFELGFGDNNPNREEDGSIVVYQFSKDEVDRVLSISPVDGDSPTVKVIGTLSDIHSSDHTASFGSANITPTDILFSEDKIIFISTTDEYNMTLSTSLTEIRVNLKFGDREIKVPTISLDGESGEVNVSQKADGSIDISLDIPINNRLQF